MVSVSVAIKGIERISIRKPREYEKQEFSYVMVVADHLVSSEIILRRWLRNITPFN